MGIRIPKVHLPWLVALALAGRAEAANDARPLHLESRHGVWVLGPAVELVPEDGARLQAAADLKQPEALLLADGSVLIHGDRARSEGKRLLWIRPQGDHLQVRELGSASVDGRTNQAGEVYREPRSGLAATELADGGVLLLGGSGTALQAAVLDLYSGQREPAGPLPHPRVDAATLRLADGRIAVAGCAEGETGDASASAVDLFSPQQGRWSTLPPLPMPLCAQFRDGLKPSLLQAPDGALIAGGHYEPHVMRLAADASHASGFAEYWTLAGRLPGARIGGRLQIGAGGTIELQGGFSDRGGWSADALPIDLAPASPPQVPYAAALHGVATTIHSGRAVLLAGRALGPFGRGHLRFSRVVELLDLNSGALTQLPPLPFASGGGDALWLDASNLVFKGRTAANERDFEADQPLGGRIGNSSGALAVFELGSTQWRQLKLSDEHAHSRLLAASTQELQLLGADGRVYRIDWRGQVLERSRAQTLDVRNARLRRLENGRLIVAGGNAPEHLVSTGAAECDRPSAHCEEQFVGIGIWRASRHHHVLEPDADGQLRWRRSTPSEAAGREAAIAANGAVVRIGWLEPPAQSLDSEYRYQPPLLLIERSNADGTAWQRLPAPADLQPGSGHDAACAQQELRTCRLHLLPDPRHPGQELLFLSAGTHMIEGHAADDHRLWLWWFDPEREDWLQLAELRGRDVHEAVQSLPPPLSTSTHTLQALGWHFERPLLWARPAAQASKLNATAGAD
jgi:hypothetical protein